MLTVRILSFEDLMFNTESVPSNISYNSFKTSNLPMQNSYCDFRNFDSVIQASGKNLKVSTIPAGARTPEPEISQVNLHLGCCEHLFLCRTWV